MAVTGQQVADFLGCGDDEKLVALAAQHAEIVTALARSYTRGRGFLFDEEAAEDIEAAIITATARLVANPEQLSSDFGSVALRGGWQGWNLAEQIVLNRYRVRAQ